MSLAGDVARFDARCAATAANLAAVEAALGRPAPPPFAPPPPRAAARNGIPASAADVGAARTMLAALDDALGGLAQRVANLAEAVAVFTRAPRAAQRFAPAPAADLANDDALSRVALDALQKQLVAGEDRLAGLELRVAAAEDALDAFFGTMGVP